eukprot:TRINITY_DN81230_c0_g1_i1.p1 TRINITY_DN81230_c0_g1~~TRINITY_DN81230_c0_g1_i1.p1  ORF type:complete len:154 (-),score=26.66 TRINITY_DN81230_c0_g1_i1:143-604(-)
MESSKLYSDEEWAKMGWDDSYSVGVDIIDDRHKILFKMIYEIKELLAWNFDSEKEAYDRLVHVFDGLIDYSGFHFDEEEGIMIEQGYDKDVVRDHIQIHDNFIQQILRFRCNVELGISDETQDLSTMLSDWLINHIKKNDQRLGNFLNSVGYF